MLDTPAASLPARAAVVSVLRRVNDHWIGANPSPGRNDWARATYFSGNMALHRLLREPRYLDYATRWAAAHGYRLMPFHPRKDADNQCAGQVYLDLFEVEPDPSRIADTERRLRSLVFGDRARVDTDWSWVDALHMAMPLFARFGKLRRDPRYWVKMYRLYAYAKRTAGGGLYDSRGGRPRLWWRDRRFVPPGGELSRSPNGKAVYWSRGNGWALAAHVKVLRDFPPADLRAPEYRQTLVAMCQALRPIQRSDGFWNVNLGDPEHSPGPETSGSAFFSYGLAYAINAGLLPRASYLPTLAGAWNGMVAKAVRDDGLLGYVQGVGDRPPARPPSATDTADFGVGAFLLAGTEVAKLTA